MRSLLTISLIFIISTINNHSLAKDLNNSQKSQIFHGYITNKTFKPLKLKISEIDKKSLFFIERDLENNSFIPFPNLKITSEITQDYLVKTFNESIFIPESTKLTGYISEIKEPKIFNRKGFYKAGFNKAICPNGETIFLDKEILSNSINNSPYHLLHHVGKTTLGLLGGSLAGALVSYQAGGLGLTLATHGYSLLAGAAAGGFIGLASSFASKGEKANIEPGDELYIAPVDEVSLNELKQIKCLNSKSKTLAESTNNNEVKVEIINVKQKRDLLGENTIRIKILFFNNSEERFRSSNFFLRDSQGKEYTTSFINLNDDIMTDFPPNETKKAELEFFVDHPKASHTLVLKDKYFNEEIGNWKIKG